MKIYNFSAGPAVLPQPVLERAREELLDWRGSGMSVMEMSHRGKEFISIAERAEADLRTLLAVPENYKVLFLQGGATTQFAMVPMNLLGERRRADYIHTGEWAKKAIVEARKYCDVNVAASSEAQKFSYAPVQSEWQLSAEAAYVHYTANETIGGVEFHWIPDAGAVPLVCDISSNMLSRPLPIERFGLLYGGAQKNIGPAGLTIVIVREDLLGKAPARTPSMLDYAVHAEADSMYNTPPTWAIYMAGLTFQWMLEQGGVSAMEERNAYKAALLYELIDRSGLYVNPVRREDRSRMNVPFTLRRTELEPVFLKEAEAAGFLQLKGHRSVGGMRASLYNAMPLAGVQALAGFMAEFEARHA